MNGRIFVFSIVVLCGLLLPVVSKADLVVSGGNQIFVLDDNGGNRRNVISDSTPSNSIGHVAIDVANRKIYWTNSGKDTVERANFGGSNIQTIFSTSSFSNPNGIDIDAANNTVFFTDTGQSRLNQMDLDGSNFMSSSVTVGARGVALDIANGHVYVAHFGSIRRYDMGSGSFTTLVSTSGAVFSDVSVSEHHNDFVV